ncbi:hypothetical protein Efla_003305 [Eimeria flavescens]
MASQSRALLLPLPLLLPLLPSPSQRGPSAADFCAFTLYCPQQQEVGLLAAEGGRGRNPIVDGVPAAGRSSPASLEALEFPKSGGLEPATMTESDLIDSANSEWEISPTEPLEPRYETEELGADDLDLEGDVDKQQQRQPRLHKARDQFYLLLPYLLMALTFAVGGYLGHAEALKKLAEGHDLTVEGPVQGDTEKKKGE